MGTEALLSKPSFDAVTAMFHRVSGIRLGQAKLPLVSGRLQRLAQQRGIADLERYVAELIHRGDAEEQIHVIDKLTTNETYFFREPEHFDALHGFLSTWAPQAAPLRVWSAASSSGEEAYSIAMLLADVLGIAGWEVLGTDLSTAMVESARRGLYTMERGRNVPADYLKRWCLKGQGEHAGSLLVARELRQHVRFECANLMQPLPSGMGVFDVIFLRNVLIYFDAAAKTQIVRRVLGQLAPRGLLFTGHAESIINLDLPLRSLASAIYVHADHPGAD